MGETIEQEEQLKDSCIVHYILTETLREYKDVNIPTDEADYTRLKEDIQKNNIRQPLQVHKKTVLAGNTRLRIAKELDIKFVPCLYLPDDMIEIDQKEYVITDNLSRRHLTTIQKADLALQLVEIETARAEKRQKQTRLTGGKDKVYNHGAVNSDLTEENTDKSSTYLFNEDEKEGRGKALEIAAEKAGISYGTAFKARAIRSENPELYKDVIAGYKTLDEGYKIVKAAPKSEKINFKDVKPKPIVKVKLIIEGADVLCRLLVEVSSNSHNYTKGDLQEIKQALYPLSNRIESFTKITVL